MLGSNCDIYLGLLLITVVSYSFHLFFNESATTDIYTDDTLFPYTTLFRSAAAGQPCHRGDLRQGEGHDGQDDVLKVAAAPAAHQQPGKRSEEHTSELQSLMRNSYAVFCLKKKNKQNTLPQVTQPTPETLHHMFNK